MSHLFPVPHVGPCEELEWSEPNTEDCVQRHILWFCISTKTLKSCTISPQHCRHCTSTAWPGLRHRTASQHLEDLQSGCNGFSPWEKTCKKTQKKHVNIHTISHFHSHANGMLIVFKVTVMRKLKGIIVCIQECFKIMISFLY